MKVKDKMRVLSIITIIILISATMFITVTKPQMHKRIVFGSAGIQIADIQPESETIETKVTPVQSETVKKEVEVQKVDNTDFKNELRLKALEALADKEAEFKLAQEKAANVAKQAEADMKKLKQQQEAEEKARKQAEKQAKKDAEELAKKQAQLQEAQAAAQKQAEEQAKKAAAEKAKKQAEEQAKKAAAEKAKKQAEEQAKKAAAEKAKKQAEEQAKKAAAEKAQKQAEEQKKLVEYQETILWNQWRATVCNKVTSNLDKQFTAVAPPGTIYTYSFNVDKNRRITIVTVKISKGYVNTSTQQGVNMIKYAINSLNLSTILTFPSGTQRTSVKVESGIETTSAQSSSLNANSFNDVETITKQKYE